MKKPHSHWHLIPLALFYWYFIVCVNDHTKFTMTFDSPDTFPLIILRAPWGQGTMGFQFAEAAKAEVAGDRPDAIWSHLLGWNMMRPYDLDLWLCLNGGIHNLPFFRACSNTKSRAKHVFLRETRTSGVSLHVSVILWFYESLILGSLGLKWLWLDIFTGYWL